MDACDFRDNPQKFLDGLITNPIDVKLFVTDDGGGFVYNAIRSALERLDKMDVKDYVFRLKNAGYDVVEYGLVVPVQDLDILN